MNRWGLAARLWAFIFLMAVPLCAAAGHESGKPFLFVGNDSIPPMISLENGKPVGIVVDIAGALADRTGIKVEIRPMDWALAQSMVLSGEADALLQINRNPERERIYDFSMPLLESRFSIFRKDSRLDIRNISSLYGGSVGVEEKGYPVMLMKKFPEIRVRIIPDWETGFGLVNDGQLDAVVVDRWVGEYELNIHDIQGIVVVDEPVETGMSAIAVKKGNTELLARINAGLRSIREDGTMRTILDSWRKKEIVYFTRDQLTSWLIFSTLATLMFLLAMAILFFAQQTRKLKVMVGKRTAELETVNQELTQFVYVASHDLQEPLRTMSSYVGFLKEDLREECLDENVREELRFIGEAAARMQQMIQALLNYSRAGRLEIKARPVNLEETMAIVMDNLKTSITDKQARVTWTNLPVVRGDPTALVSVLQNLVDNGLKFQRLGIAPEIRVEGERIGEFCRIRVTDNGIGMEGKYLDQIFQPFKRLHGKKEYPGTGLGLSIVYKIVERHGGSIEVASTPGRGSEFVLHLPAASEIREEATKQADADEKV